MAKKKQRKQSVPKTDATLASLSAKVRNAIRGIKAQFARFIDEFRIVTESRKDLAPKFMKAFALWQQEVGGTFVQFTRVVDPSIPEKSRTTPDGPGYKDHPSYQAAEYLRRLAGARPEGVDRETPTERATRIANAPVPPTVAVARLLKAIMPLLQQEQSRTLFDALRTQLHWPDRTVQRIETETRNVEPLVILREPRGVHALGAMRLVQAPTPAPEELAATGTQG